MTNYRYAAKNNAGAVVTGQMSADDSREVAGKLREKNLTGVEVKGGRSGRGGGGGGGSAKGTGKGFGALFKANVKKKELVLFTRQLATMIGAGIPLLESLEILVDQAETPILRETLRAVTDDIRSGKDLSHSLERHPKVFSNIFVSLIRAGEASGQLDEILNRLADYTEASEKLRREIKSAMTYPVVSLALILSIASFLMIGIVPKFKPIFDALGVELPAVTRAILGVADFCQNHWPVMFGGFAAFGFGVGAFKRTKKGRRFFDWFVLHVPVFGQLFRKVALSRFARTFSTLIKSGVPILEALEIVSATLGNQIIAEVVEEAREHVRQGETLAEPLAKHPIFPPMVTKMIGIGEKSGALETLLEKIAVFYDDQVNAEVKGMTSLIEPILIGVIGFLVAGIVLAVFLPIFKLQQELANMR